MTKHSPKRLVVESVRYNLKRVSDLLSGEQQRRQSCETGWGQRHDLANDPRCGGIIKWTDEDEKQQKEALAGYDRKIADLEGEVKKWEEALSHALDALEGRA